jgi:1-acyl-sn-glycerol-3-phosphate acyltransferase
MTTWRDRTDFAFHKKISPILDFFYHTYFRCRIIGWDHIPLNQKAVFYGNHNGLLTFEVILLAHAWFKKYGDRYRVLGLSHRVALDHPLFAWLTRRLGAIPADPEVAREALDQNYSLLVYPGGEKESFRPFCERKKVDFYGRLGFIKLAHEKGVPLVPIMSVGAHETYVILSRGERLAKVLGLKKRYRLHGLPITFRNLLWLVSILLVCLGWLPVLVSVALFLFIWIPLPSRMTFKILEPIHLEEIWNSELTVSENYQMIYEHCVEVLQMAVLQEYAERS